MTDEEEAEYWRRRLERDERDALLDNTAYALGCLADNLGIAAALCKAFELGVDCAELVPQFGSNAYWKNPPPWEPGCQRRAL